jgi:shikimate kinase
MGTNQNRNIVLIGMPGVGKSTLGVVLAKDLGYDFVDTDLLIQHRAKQTLAGFIQDHGYQALRTLEAEVISSLDVKQTVIATGGSAVYSDTAMTHLGTGGHIIYLRCSLAKLDQRIASMADRGIAAPPGQSLDEIEAERAPLYQRYANHMVDLTELDMQQASARLRQVVRDLAV